MSFFVGNTTSVLVRDAVVDNVKSKKISLIILIVTMKIVFFYPHYAQKAGTERILIDKMNWLSSHGYEIIALSYEQADHPFAYPLSDKVKRIDLNVRFFPLYRFSVVKRAVLTIILRCKFVLRMYTFIKHERPDLMMCTTYDAFGISVLSRTCPALSVPFVIESHSVYKESFSADVMSLFLRRKKLLPSRQVRKASRIVALTEGDAAEWRQVSKNVVVIPNMVHLNKEDSHANIHSRSVIFVGRFVEIKGLPNLLRIWTEVQQHHPDWQLDMYGTGSLKEWLNHEIETKKLHIKVHEPDAEIMQRYKQSSILVLTSISESFGLVLVEAMSCGLPVVAFDCPYGPNDIITNGKDGFLVKQNDVKGFAERLCSLMENPNLRQRIGEEALATSKRYDEDVIMPMWHRFFSQYS